MDLEIHDHWVLVAGASNGLGASVTSLLLAEGARVLAVSRRPLTAPLADSDRLLTVQADLSTSAGEGALRETLKLATPLRGVVASVGSGAGLPGSLVERFASASKRNVLPLLRTLDACEDFLMKDKRSSVVLVSSIAALEYMSCPPEYAAAKASVVALSGHLARQWAPARVNAIAPGNMLSRGSVWERKSIDDPAALERFLGAEVALGRLGSPDEVARVVVFLLSPLAGFISGSTLVADGGQSRTW